MNLWLSLLVFNPLEVLVIYWGLHLINKKTRYNKFEFFSLKNIKDCYILGAINLCVQYIPLNSDSAILHLFMILFLGLIVAPLILWLYSIALWFLKKQYKIFKLKDCFIVQSLYMASTLLTVSMFNYYNFANIINYNVNINEFITNLLIKLIQIIILLIVNNYEKIFKIYCKNCI